MKQLEKEYNTTIRESTPADAKSWAYRTTLKRATIGDYVFELTANGKPTVYVLENIKAGSNKLIGVCEKPSDELLEMITTNNDWA
jgi:hypothetical protein